MKQRFNTGMTRSGPETTEMKPKDIEKVLKLAQKFGVTKIKIGTLEAELVHVPRAVRPAFKASKKKIREVEEQNDAQLQFDDAKEELAVMHVEDPAGFEAALIDKELVDAPDAGEQLEETHAI